MFVYICIIHMYTFINKLTLYIVYVGPFTDHATRMVTQRDIIETIIGHNSDPSEKQEVHMFDNFAQIITDNYEHTNSTRCVTYEHLTLVTQSIIDTCYKSMKSGGEEVTCPTWEHIFEY